ncbi:MAG: glycosyltransferase family 39 protein [Ardenticatenales bacterium]|nr:glycosyltransferase family 39 protein [Ardenticatenales bacterium]MCB9171332.1 glycosyltransferase family 39 protein [Ardenticatenales bacterium]
MNRPASTPVSRRLFAAFPLLLAGVGAWLVWRSTAPYGIGLTTDPVGYLSVARNVVAGQGWVGYYAGFPDSPLLYWPPLYPALLALLAALGIEPLLGVRLLNTLLFAATLAVGAAWLQRHLRRGPWVVLGGAAMLLAPPLLRVAISAYSEALFILLLLLFLWALAAHLAQPRLLTLGALTLTAALAMLTRYVGVVLLPVGVVALLWLRRPLRRGLWESVSFAFLSWLPLGGWWLRNYRLSGEITGPRGRATESLADNLKATVDIFAGWMVPQSVPNTVAALLLIALLVGAAVGYRAQRDRASTRVLLPPLLLLIIFPLFLILSASAVAYNVMIERFYTPLYIPLLWLLFFALDRIMAVPRQRNIALYALLALWLLFNAATVGDLVATAMRQGVEEYNGARWRDSALIAQLRAAPVAGPVYSNAPYPVYLYTALEPTISPRQQVPPIVAGSPAEDLAAFRAVLAADEPLTLIWFDNDFTRGDTSLFDVATLAEQLPAQFSVVQRVSDGVIYEVRAAPPR